MDDRVREMVQQFVATRWNVPREQIDLVLNAMRGGLESQVAMVHVSTRPARPSIPRALVVKELLPEAEREADIYGALWDHLPQPPSPRLLGEEHVGGRRYLYLEAVPRLAAWPWAATEHAAAVCRELAAFHDATQLPRELFGWGYELELAQSAEATLEVALAARDANGRRHFGRVGDLRRVVNALPSIRAQLLASEVVVLHGDVHPGNVILRRGAAGDGRVMLIDWTRARLGSPMEDVASWLHSLGCWEPEARRRHDTLLRAYLAHRRGAPALTNAVRRDYWLASVSNGLAGAIRFHLVMLADRSTAPRQRHNSFIALQAWGRVIRRGAALLSTSRAGCMSPAPAARCCPTALPWQ